MSTPRPSHPKLLDAEITIVSAKHLKNVNWRHGDLKPYAVLYLEPDRRVATKPDDSGSTRPVWNERFTLSLPAPLHESFLTVEIFHSKPSETPKPLVGAVRSPLKDLIDGNTPTGGPTPIRTLEIRRPSGRPQGKIRIKINIQERPSPPTPDYHIPPPSSYYYSTAPPPSHQPPSVRDYRSYSPSPPPPPSRTYSPPPPPPLSYGAPQPPQTSQYLYGNYSDPYSGYYNPAGYYSVPPAPVPARPYYDRASSYSGPSAPVDYSSGSSSYEQKPRGSKMGMGAGLAVGAVAGALGGLALDEGLKYEEDKIADRVEDDLAPSEDYTDHRREY